MIESDTMALKVVCENCKNEYLVGLTITADVIKPEAKDNLTVGLTVGASVVPNAEE